MTYQGSCHCGRIKFEADGEIGPVMACNCSMCQRKGILMWFVPQAKMRLLTPPEAMSTYLFNKHVIKHRFCPNCGIHTHGEAVSPSGEPTAAINVRCIEGIDLQTLTVKHFDGRSKL